MDGFESSPLPPQPLGPFLKLVWEAGGSGGMHGVDPRAAPQSTIFFFSLVAPCSLWYFSSQTRDGTWALAVKVPNHSTAREFQTFNKKIH